VGGQADGEEGQGCSQGPLQRVHLLHQGGARQHDDRHEVGQPEGHQQGDRRRDGSAVAGDLAGGSRGVRGHGHRGQEALRRRDGGVRGGAPGQGQEVDQGCQQPQAPDQDDCVPSVLRGEPRAPGRGERGAGRPRDQRPAGQEVGGVQEEAAQEVRQVPGPGGRGQRGL